MRISFDIDDTLICYQSATPCEPVRVPGILRRWLREPLRQGAPELIRTLQSCGHEVCIYTTSGRSAKALRFWLRLYGVKIAEVINQSTHERVVWRQGQYPRCSKYPPAFGIDLHVDDSDGVELEGKRHGFRVLVVSPDDREWARRVLDAVGAASADHP